MILDNIKTLNIIQFGVGGTGSWLVPLIVKFLKNIKNRYGVNLNISYILIDDDIVEERNILRQNFNYDDINRNKAQIMIRRYVPIFDRMFSVRTKIKSTRDLNKLFNNDFNDSFTYIEKENSLTIIFGCIDNNESRILMYKFLKRQKFPIVYIDSGNLLYNGQIVTQKFNSNNLFINDKTFKNINFLKYFDTTEENEDTQSCAFFGDQSQSINNIASAILFASFQNLIINDTLPPPVVKFNNTGYCTFDI